MNISPITPKLIDNAKKNMIVFMKNSRKTIRIISSIILCWGCNSPINKTDHVYYYLETCKEDSSMTRYSARIYMHQKGDRILERVYVYNNPIDSVTTRDSRLYRKDGLTLISYTSLDDKEGQIYLKVKLDTSFIFEYEDPLIDHFLGTKFQYLGKDSLQKHDKQQEFYKFREIRHDTEFYVYLDNNFILERLEWITENYLHCAVQRLDSCQVPQGLIENMKRIKQQNSITQGK